MNFSNNRIILPPSFPLTIRFCRYASLQNLTKIYESDNAYNIYIIKRLISSIEKIGNLRRVDA